MIKVGETYYFDAPHAQKIRESQDQWAGYVKIHAVYDKTVVVRHLKSNLFIDPEEIMSSKGPMFNIDHFSKNYKLVESNG